jgi:hypothetical protein
MTKGDKRGWKLTETFGAPPTWLLPVGSPSFMINFFVLAIGSVCTFTYLAYIYVKSRSVWVTSVAHITLNNSAAAFSYFAVIQNQILANVGLTLTILIVIAILYYRKEWNVFAEYFANSGELQDLRLSGGIA